MRLISQSGIYDINYERALIEKDEGYVITLIDGQRYVMGTYSKPERAEQVMYLLHRKYNLNSGQGVFKFPKDSEVLDVDA